jgi:acetyl-CoA carboxylase carboxyl transferase subunit alpha
MTRLKTSIITIVIGEGASGGAVGIGVGNKVYMMENTWYTVISPESCSSILWRSWEYKEQAAAALKLTGEDMKRLKLIDGIIKEPVGGAHSNRDGAFESVKNTILSAFEELKDLSDEEIVSSRMQKYAEMGVYKE